MPPITLREALVAGGLAGAVLLWAHAGAKRKQGPCCADCAARAAGGYTSPDGSGPAGGNAGLLNQDTSPPSGYGGNFTGGRHH